MSIQAKYDKILTKEFLYQAYIIEGKTQQDIANEANCGETTVARYLTTHGIVGKQGRFQRILTEEFLYAEYAIKGRLAKDIADDIGCNRATVCEYLRKYKIRKFGCWYQIKRSLLSDVEA